MNLVAIRVLDGQKSCIAPGMVAREALEILDSTVGYGSSREGYPKLSEGLGHSLQRHASPSKWKYFDQLEPRTETGLQRLAIDVPLLVVNRYHWGLDGNIFKSI